MSASDMASKLSGMSFAFGLRTQFAELVKRTKDQMEEAEESEQLQSEDKTESATTEEGKEVPTAQPQSPDQRIEEKTEKPAGAEPPQVKSPEEKPRSVRDMIARFQGGDSSSGPRKSRPKESAKSSSEPPGKDKQSVAAKKEKEKPKEEKTTKAEGTAVASKSATEQTSTDSSKSKEHIEQVTETPALSLVSRAIRGIEQKAETVLNKQRDTPVVVPVTKEKEAAPVVVPESKGKEAAPVEPSSNKTVKPAEPIKETSTVEVKPKETDTVQPVAKKRADKKQPSIEKQTLQQRNQEGKKETQEAPVSKESPPVQPPVQQVQLNQAPPSEDKIDAPQKVPSEPEQDGKADISHLAVRKTKKAIPRERSSSYDPESDHSGDETSSGEGPASRAGSIILSSPEPSPDEEEMGCKTFMEMFVSNVFNGSPVGPDEQSHFGEMCRKPAGRKWFARQVNSERCNTKCVSETTFYRLVQCFAVALFECGEADDFIPAKTLMNMCFTFYYEDQPEPGKEQKVFLYMYLKDQPVWKSIRFWNAAFFESVQHERTQRGAPSTREGWRSLSSEERQDSHKANENITFGQLGTFTSNMVAFGLSKDLILEFLRKQSIIGNLSADQYDMLKEHVEKEEIIQKAEPESPHNPPTPTPSPVAETPPDKEKTERERNNSGSKMLNVGLSSLRKISTSLKTWKGSNGSKDKEKE